MTDYKDDIGSLSLERGTGPSMNDEMSQRPSLDITRQQELDKGSANLEQITNSLDGQLNTLLENIDIPNSQKQYLKEEMIDEIYKQGGENAKVTALHYSEESGLMHAEVNHFLDAYVDVKESLNQRSTFLEQPAVTQSEESTNIPSQTLDSNIIQNEDGLSRHEQLQISQEKINEISSVYENRLSNINQELSTINEARQIEGYWEQSQEIINIDMDRAEQLLSQRQNLYEILDRTPDEQQTYLDNHPEFDLVLNERDYDKVQTTLDDLSETMPKAIKLEDNPDDYKVGAWDSVKESINDTLQQSDDAIRESLKVEAADDSFLADMKRNAAASLALVEGGYDLGKETIEGLWDLTAHSTIGIGTGYTGLADAITGGYLSESFDFVQHANEYNVQAHTLATNIAEITMPILADVQLSQEGFLEATDRTYERATALKNSASEQLKNLSLSYSTSDIDGMRGAGKIALDGALTFVPIVGATKLSKIERLENLADLAHKYPDELLRNGDHLIDRKLQSNVLYKTGEYDYLYKTDDLGRLHEFHAEDLGATLRADRLPHDAQTPGKLQGDHAGHLAGDRFGGSPEIDNLVSQLSSVNLSEYKKLENSWAKAIDKGEKVSVNVKINYEGDNLRPSSFDVDYEIAGKPFFAEIPNK